MFETSVKLYKFMLNCMVLVYKITKLAFYYIRKTFFINSIKLKDLIKMKLDIDDEWNLKIVSWNVSGLRSCVSKGCVEYLLKENADIICLNVINLPT